MKIFENPAPTLWNDIATRPAFEKENLRQVVSEIFDNVKDNGDEALKFYTKKFDNCALEDLRVSEKEINEALTLVEADLRHAISIAKNNIEKFHRSQMVPAEKIETTIGVTCWREARPIEKVGIYIPGGTAPLFSTVLMLATPAQIANCEDVVLCSPPDDNGKIHPAILYAAAICGVKKIFKIGGAQAIAALTFGTQSVPKVYKIFGPGNQFVTAAKEYAVDFGTAIDLPAGPSEVLVIADGQAVPNFCAADLLSQAEHGADSQVVFLATDRTVFNLTIEALQSQLEQLPRKELARKALENSSFILFDNLEKCIDFSNLYAPEHLILAIKNPEDIVGKISNAGSVFMGNFSCESAGDYASGTNHTLPTNGFARNYSGVSLDSFVKKITFQNIHETGIKNLGKTIETMAAAEGLFAHKNAVSVRLKYLNDEGKQ